MMFHKTSMKLISCLIFIFSTALSQNTFAQGGYYWDLYCKESGRAGATDTCIPAIEKPWEYYGGSYGWQYHTKIYDTEGGVAADMAGYIDRTFSTCSPTVVHPPVKWISTGENHGRISYVSDMTMTVSRGTPRCESLTGGWQSVYNKTKQFYCPQGAQGPFKSDGGSRFCAIALHSCKKNAYTPNPISVSNGVKEFPRVYDDTVLKGFNLYRSYISLPSYSGAGALNPSRSPANTQLPLMRETTVGWRLSYEATLSYYRNVAENRDVYTVDIPGYPPSVFVGASAGFVPQRSNSDSFQAVSNGNFIYRSGGGEYWVFDSSRKLIATGNASGDKVTISGANPIIATNQFGRQLALHKNGNGVLSSIELPDGSELQYDFDSSLRLETVKIQKVQGTFPVSKYYYEDARYPWVITGIANESGQRISVYEYDDKGRAFRSSNFAIPSVNKYTLNYSSGTQVIDPLGTTRKYTFTYDGFSTVDIIDPKIAPSAAITNDVKGRPFVEYDFNNNQACVFYNDPTNKSRVRIEGMQKYAGCAGYDAIGITLPVGARKISTEWHPDWSLPTRVAEPLRRSTYVYNGQPDPLNGNAIASCAPSAAAYPDGKPLAALCKLVLQDTTDATGTSGFSAAVTGSAKVWTYAYNAQGQRISETQPAPGGTTTYSYYTDTTSTHSVGDLQSSVDATGKTTVFSSYTTDGRLLQKTDPTGLVTSYTYDARGRLLTQAMGDLVTTMAYSPLGLVSSVKSPNGHAIAYTYDAANRLTGWSDNRGNSGTYVLDGMGNRTAETIKGAGGDVAWQLSRSINAINRPGNETVGGSQSNAHTYDGNGDVTSDTNGLNQVTSYGYDRLRRVSQITSPLNASATLAYNQLDAVIQAKDFKGVTTTFTRDALGNPLLETTPDAGALQTTFNNLGLPQTITDALSRTTHITYDTLARPTLIEFSANGTSRTSAMRYDLAGAEYNAAGAPNSSIGRLSEIEDPGLITRYQRDAMGRITRKTQILASASGTGDTRSVSYSYVPAGSAGGGQIASITYPSGKQLTHHYDATGQLTSLSWNGSALVTALTWTPLGQPSGWKWNGFPKVPGSTDPLEEIRNYTSANQLANSALLELAWDAAGRVTQIRQQYMVPGSGSSPQQTTLTSAYSYDAAGHLTASAHSGPPGLTLPSGRALSDFIGIDTTGYAWDANGNRTQAYYSAVKPAGTTTLQRVYQSVSGSNRLQGYAETVQVPPGPAQTSNVTYAYDATGALTKKGDSYLHYAIDGRIAQASASASPGGAQAVNYMYNSLAQRILKRDTRAGANVAQQTLYAEDGIGSTVLGQYSSQRSSTSASPTGEPDSTEIIYLPTANGPMPVAAQINGRLYAIDTDHLATPRRLTNQDGQVAWQWLISGFGEVQPTTGARGYEQAGAGASYSEPVNFNLRYPGQVWDDETGLSYNLNRYYDVSNGRYTQADPIGLEGGWNRFAYVGGDPLSHSDPTGLAPNVKNASCTKLDLQVCDAKCGSREKVEACYVQNIPRWKKYDPLTGQKDVEMERKVNCACKEEPSCGPTCKTIILGGLIILGSCIAGPAGGVLGGLAGAAQ